MDRYTNVISKNYGGGLYGCVIARSWRSVHDSWVALSLSDFFYSFCFHCDFLLYNMYVLNIKYFLHKNDNDILIQ